MTRDFETLIKQGYSATDHAQQILENELGILYRDAYEQAAKELGELYLKLGDKVDLPEARKYRRLESLMKSLSDAYKEVTGQTVALTGNNSYQAYMDAFHRTTWSFEQSLFEGYQLDTNKIAMDLSWGVVPQDAIIASIMSENSGLTYIKTFAKNMDGQLWKIQSAITRGIANGHSYKKTAKSLEDQFNGGFSDAMRVVRTESGRNYTQGNLAAHDRAVEAGIKVRKKWVSTLDGRTRPEHGAADGQYADAQGNFHVGGATGPGPGLLDRLDMIVNCRCRFIDELEGFPPELRRIGDEVKPYITFKDWAIPQGWSAAKGWPRVNSGAKSKPNTFKMTPDEQDLVNDYTDSMYQYMNSALRNPLSDRHPLVDEKIKGLSELIEKQPEVSGTFYRGIKDGWASRIAAEYGVPMNSLKLDPSQWVDTEIEELAFMSTSSKRDGIKGFSHSYEGVSTILEIKGKARGLDVSKVPTNAEQMIQRVDESEVIFNKGTKLRITKASYNEDWNRFEMEAEFVE